MEIVATLHFVFFLPPYQNLFLCFSDSQLSLIPLLPFWGFWFFCWKLVLAEVILNPRPFFHFFVLYLFHGL